MALTIGTKLGSHEITGVLGKGGMGEVYRARDAKLERDVAIKVLPEVLAGDSGRMSRFEREARLLAALDHPNIAAIYGLEDSGGRLALVMQLAEGPTLADRIGKGPIPIEEAVSIARQIAEALEYAHERGIIHRDLKPANLKVGANNAVKVLDFGLAKAMESEAQPEDASNSPTLSRMATQAGVLLGTAAYMAPEQAKGKPVDRRADIWAFGCVLYEMLTGTIAFQGETATDTLAAVIKEEPDWSRLPAATPAPLRLLLRRCLRKDSRQRLRDIGDARITLDEVLSGAGDLVPAGAEKSGAWSDVMRFEISLPGKAEFDSFATSAFAISPDGRHLAFAAGGSDGLRLWVRSLNSLEARPLYGSESPLIPGFCWSQDCRFLAFAGAGKLKKIDVSGGPAQTLCDAAGVVVGAAWRHDGQILFGQSRGGIMRVSANGGAPVPVTVLDPSRKETWHVHPSLLPDGVHFIYLRGAQDPENTGIYIGSLDARPDEQDLRPLVTTHVGAAYVPPFLSGLGHILFHRDGSLFAQAFDANRLEFSGGPALLAKQIGAVMADGFFSASKNDVLVYRAGAGMTQLSWFDQRGKRLGTVGEPATYVSVSLSPDGTRAAVSRAEVQNANLSLWLMDLGRGTSTRFTSGAVASLGIWSPDGSRLAFPFGSGVKFDLYQKSAGGLREHELLLESDQIKMPRSWSPDGRFLLYSTQQPATRRSGLSVLPLEGDRQPFPFAITEFSNDDAQFSPDGRSVAYVSDESGRNEIYVRTFSPDAAGAAANGDGKWLVSTAGGNEPRWSGDGKTLYYIAPDAKLMAVQITASSGFRAGLPKTLFQTPGNMSGSYRRSWDLTPDGKRFLFIVQTGQRTPPFNVILNWPALLGRA